MSKLRHWISLLGVGALLLIPVLVARNLASSAGATATAPPPVVASREIVSPFVPMGASVDPEALAADIRLVGARVSLDPARSGAVFVLADGSERAFVIGQQVKPGLRLTGVEADRVMLASEGGVTTLHLQGAARRLPAAAVRTPPEGVAQPIVP